MENNKPVALKSRYWLFEDGQHDPQICVFHGLHKYSGFGKWEGKYIR